MAKLLFMGVHGSEDSSPAFVNVRHSSPRLPLRLPSLRPWWCQR